MGNTNNRYDFCPRCGALMQAGTCLSCEFTINPNPNMPQMGNPNPNIPQQPQMGNPNPGQGMPQNQNYNTYTSSYPNQNGGNTYAYNYSNPAYMQPNKKKHTGLIIGIIIGGFLLLFGIVFALVIWGKSVIEDVYDKIPEGFPSFDENDDYDYDYDFDSDIDAGDFEPGDFDFDFDYDFDFDTDSETDTEDGEYNWLNYINVNEEDLIDIDGDGQKETLYSHGIEGLDAEYYTTITDYLRYDLPYAVYFEEYAGEMEEFYCVYPQLLGDGEYIDDLNGVFLDVAKGKEEMARDLESIEAECIAYVTYMDEQNISLIFINTFVMENDYTYECVDCYTFNVETFDWLRPTLVDNSDAFFDVLKNRALEQGTSDASALFSEYTYDELRGIINYSNIALFAFYTPIGMEIGLNYDGYWFCATFKDYDKYLAVSAEF